MNRKRWRRTQRKNRPLARAREWVRLQIERSLTELIATSGPIRYDDAGYSLIVECVRQRLLDAYLNTLNGELHHIKR